MKHHLLVLLVVLGVMAPFIIAGSIGDKTDEKACNSEVKNEAKANEESNKVQEQEDAESIDPLKASCQCGKNWKIPFTNGTKTSNSSNNEANDERIIKGTAAVNSTWPWAGAIASYNATTKTYSIECGCSIINNWYVMTAAHCFNLTTSPSSDTIVANWRIVLGTHSLNGTNKIVRTIATITTHPSWNQSNFQNDISIVKLNQSLNYSRWVYPICIGSDPGTPWVGANATVVGWGNTKTVSPPNYPNYLRQVTVPIVANSVCSKNYSQIINVTSTMVCAGGKDKDSCQGDSGGSMFLLNPSTNTTYLQVGIVSFGAGCATPGLPGVYTRVGRYAQWIRSVTSDATYCKT